jgi:hypothetical protein
MEIRPVGAELFHVDGQTDRQYEANSHVLILIRSQSDITEKMGFQFPFTQKTQTGKLGFEVQNLTRNRW